MHSACVVFIRLMILASAWVVVLKLTEWNQMLVHTHVSHVVSHECGDAMKC